MDKKDILYILIKRWFKDYNYSFTQTNEYNNNLLESLKEEVSIYIIEFNLTDANEDLLWAHIRFFLSKKFDTNKGNFKNNKAMLKDIEKKQTLEIISKTRPDLIHELLIRDSYIYDRIEGYLEQNNINSINENTIEEAWININLEDPIPDYTAEIDAIIERNHINLKKELTGLAMYTNILNELSQNNEVQAIYKKYNYGTKEFFYSDNFENELAISTSNFLEKHGYI